MAATRDDVPPIYLCPEGCRSWCTTRHDLLEAHLKYDHPEVVGTFDPAPDHKTRAATVSPYEEWAEWLVQINYPFDFATDPPVPEAVRGPLAEAWFRKDGLPEAGETVQDYHLTVAEEGGWPATGGCARGDE